MRRIPQAIYMTPDELDQRILGSQSKHTTWKIPRNAKPSSRRSRSFACMPTRSAGLSRPG